MDTHEIFPWQSRATNQNEKRSGDDLGLSLPIPGIWGQVFGFGQNSDSGEVVTPQSAMQVSTVWSCVRIIAESIGSLPCVLYTRTEGGRQVAFDNPFYRLLRDTPNDEQTGVVFCGIDGNVGVLASWTSRLAAFCLDVALTPRLMATC
jgi:phage portal protein BeeE